MCNFLYTVIFVLLRMNSAGGQISHVAPLCRAWCSRRSSWPRSELRSTLRCRTCGPSACWVTVTASGSSTCPPSSGRRAPRCARCTRRTTSSNTWRTARWCCRTRWDADRVEGCSGFRVTQSDCVWNAASFWFSNDYSQYWLIWPDSFITCSSQYPQSPMRRQTGSFVELTDKTQNRKSSHSRRTWNHQSKYFFLIDKTYIYSYIM